MIIYLAMGLGAYLCALAINWKEWKKEDLFYWVRGAFGIFIWPIILLAIAMDDEEDSNDRT